ncbi:MAG: DegV family protein [Thermoleophilia bacterium]|nr:DegV family protein [Thermoleophilia bacterium]
MQGKQDATGTIAIVTDATADVPPAERDPAMGIPWRVVAETWRTPDGLEFLDDGSDSRELVALALESGLDPEPSEPSRDDFIGAYEHLREIDRVFSIHAPAKASWAVEHAREAAGAFPNVRVIETNVTGIGLGLLAARARDMSLAGAGPDDVERWLRRHREAVKMLVVPDRFDPMASQRGLSARLLAGRSMLHSGEGSATFDRSRRLRTRRATVAAIERYFLEHTSDDDSTVLHLALAHGDAAGAVDPFLDLLERMRPHAEVSLIGRVGPRLIQQLGARCVAAAWVEEIPEPQGDD